MRTVAIVSSIIDRYVTVAHVEAFVSVNIHNGPQFGAATPWVFTGGVNILVANSDLRDSYGI